MLPGLRSGRMEKGIRKAVKSWDMSEDEWEELGREMLEGAPVPGLPEEIIEEKISVMQLLCDRYTGTQGEGWSMVVGWVAFSTMLALAGDYKYAGSRLRDPGLCPSQKELKYQVKSYLLLSLRAYLDVRRAYRRENGAEAGEQIQSNRVE